VSNLLRRLKQWVLSPVSRPQYVAVGLQEPQQLVEVWLHGCGEPLKVTCNNVVAALRPLTIGVMLDRGGAVGRLPGVRLEFRDRRASNARLGVIHLTAVQDLALPPHVFRLFKAAGCENDCLPILTRGLYYRYERRKAERYQRRNPHNFQMAHSDLRALFAFYICPRPVVLVSVEHEADKNIFPMDLIGPTDSRWYSMALRATSPAIALMQRSRRLALASVPLSYTRVAYELGKHHRQASIDWNALPFSTVPSPMFGLSVPAAALRVREVRVEHFYEVGSHVLFLTSVVGDTIPDRVLDGPGSLQLFHIHGAYHEYLKRRHVSLPEA
jgi:flavin reductase (DIM6/NTAB) family NADH-FMN oxidoreductase RutF